MTKFAVYDPDPVERPPPFGGRVRRAVPEDADAIAAITVERSGLDPEKILRRTRKELAAQEEDGSGALFVAEEDGRVLGFGRVRLVPVLEEVAEDLRPPPGWYLLGVVVTPADRRRGIARALTRHRLDWLARRTDHAYYFARDTNRPSLDLHTAFGFEEVTRRFHYPRTGLEPGEGILYRIDLG